MAARLPPLAGTWFAASALPVILALPLAKKKHMRNSGDKPWDHHFNPTLHSYAPQTCRLCDGECTIACDSCGGKGRIDRGGFSRNNMVRVASLVGSKWTSMKPISGKWRHFLCIAKKGSNAKNGVATLSSTCGPVAARLRIDVPVTELKSREVWQGGWTTLNDIRASPVVATIACYVCKGEAVICCPRCEGLGRTGLI